MAETIVRARALAKQLDRSDYVLPLLGSQWNFHLARAEHKLALSLAKEMEEFGKARGDETARLLGNFSDGLSCFFLGEITAAHARFEQSLGLRDPAHRALNVAGQYAGTLVHLATTLAILGYIDQARSRVDEAVSESRRLGHALTRVDVLFWASWTEWVSGSVHALQRARGRGHGSVERTRFSVLARLGAGMPRVVVECARPGRGRPSPGHARAFAGA